MDDNLPFLPGLPVEKICAALNTAAGNEIESGKFLSPESSSALAANAFGWFLEHPTDMPALPGLEHAGPVRKVELEAEMRFPWVGGKHPWLDAAVTTDTHLIGVESKRYEPFRSGKKAPGFSDAYRRPVWGDDMSRYSAVREAMMAGALRYEALDAAQLVKHAYGLRSVVSRDGGYHWGRRPVLVYLFAEPVRWANGRAVDPARKATHRLEIKDFATRVAGDEVDFLAFDYCMLVSAWTEGHDQRLVAHAEALIRAFDIGQHSAKSISTPSRQSI